MAVSTGSSRAVHQNISNVHVAANSSAQIGIFGLIEGVDDERRRIQRWLAPWVFGDGARSDADSQLNILNQHREVRAEGSGAWLIERELPTWYNSDTDSLWLFGEVGCGKSVLCFSVIDYLWRESQKLGSRTIPAFAICAYNIEYSHQPGFLFKTLLAFLSFLDPIPGIIMAEYRKRDKLNHVDLAEMLEQVILDLDARLNEDPTLPESLMLVVDAVDEVPNLRARTQMLRALDRLHAINAKTNRFKLRLILFTRNDQQVRQHCCPTHGWKATPVPRRNVDLDIELAMKQRFARHDKMSAFSDEDKARLASQLAAKADGMFRLASLCLENLEQCDLSEFTAERLERELAELPTGLISFYDRIIRKIENGNIRKELFAALRFILYAAGPLFIEDVIQFCAVLPNGKDDDLFRPGLRLPARDIGQHLTGLIDIHPPLPRREPALGLSRWTYRVKFCHFSVAEYLRTINASQWLVSENYFDPFQAQLSITQSCFAYLRHCFRSGDVGPNAPFRAYARRHWSRHAAAYLCTTATDGSSTRRINRQQITSTVGEGNLTPPSALASQLANTLIVPEIYSHEVVKKQRESLRKITCDIGQLTEADVECLFAKILPDLNELNDHYPSNPSEDHPFARHIYAETSLEDYSNAVRLFILEPSLDRSLPVRCSLITDSLDNRPVYTALSYTWGSGGGASVYLNNQNARVSKNLRDALQHVRDSTSRLVLWADAISIDMVNLNERGQQVRLMKDIYTYAKRVEVWLGMGSEKDEDAIRHIDRLGAAGKQHSTLRWLTRSPRNSLTTVFANYVWCRAWLVQECALAQCLLIRYGSSVVSWESVHRVARSTGNTRRQARNTAPLEAQADRNLHMLARTRDRSDRPKLPELMYLTRHTESSDIRDSFFSLIGMLLVEEEQKACARLVDYNTKPWELFTQLTYLLIQRYRSLEVLSLVQKGPKIPYSYYTDAPSWVPRWGELLKEYPLAPGIFDPSQPSLYDAGAEDLELDVSPGGRLYVRAIFVDKIASICTVPTYESTLRSGSDTAYLKNLHQRINSGQQPCDQISLLELIRLCLEDRVLQAGGRFRRWDVRIDTALSANLYQQLSEVQANDSVLFKTMDGTLGKGPSMSVVGDQVVVIPGAKVPFIIRQKGRKNEFELVGECYAQGIMDGEMVRRLRENGSGVKHIVLI